MSNMIRNIGISAHIDAGKTTLTERMLFYADRIHAMHEVRGKDGVGATMDSMELERERGITIQSAATHFEWKSNHINIIDTPGHVDFTIEVERALRVLDGAVLVLCAVSGVQSQTATVDRQMKRYGVPRIAFINKCDRVGANIDRVLKGLRENLGLTPAVLQLPIGMEADFCGLVDIIEMKSLKFEGRCGEKIVKNGIPEKLRDEVEKHREALLDVASMYSDELMEAVLEDRVEPSMIRDGLRCGTLKQEIIPVFMGSAYKNRGVQPLLDGVSDYLPSPADVKNSYFDFVLEKEMEIKCSPDEPFISLAFKIEDGRYGQLTYLRIYSGTLSKGGVIHNSRTREKVKVGRVVRMHADEMQELSKAEAGDIVALFGVECASGDTFTDGSVAATMTSIHVPDPVICLTVKPRDDKSQVNMSKAIARFTREDPTFRCNVDPESGETLLSGMGELHLEVYIERMRREYKADVETGPPQTAYRETLTQRASFDYLHKKQSGGSGQFARIIGFIEPCEGEFEFESRVVGGFVPTEFIKSVERGFRTMLDRGLLIGFPVTGIRVVLEDGRAHSVDSSDMAFQAAARGAFRGVFMKTRPVILEPVMRVSVRCPTGFQGAVMKTITQRRGLIVGTTEDNGDCAVESEVPLSEMFGYATIIRSSTRGEGEFTMEFARYGRVPAAIADNLQEKYKEKALKTSRSAQGSG